MFIQIRAGEWIEDSVHLLPDETKIDQESVLAEFEPAQDHSHPPVVLVQRFHGAVRQSDGVRGSDSPFDANFKHLLPPIIILYAGVPSAVTLRVPMRGHNRYNNQQYACYKSACT